MLVKVNKNFKIYSKKGVFTFFEDEILRAKEYPQYYKLIDWDNIKVKKELFNKHISQDINDYTWVFGVLKALNSSKKEMGEC